jgi:hypothetical protein
MAPRIGNQRGGQPCGNKGFMKLALLTLAALSLHAQQTQLFSASSGDTTCKFHTNAATPTTIDFTCTNPRGTFGGYYAPAASNTATDGITIGLAGVGNTGNEVCMLGVNMTANPVTIGSFGTIPPTSVVFQCAGGSASTPILLTPPAASLKKGKNE